MPSEGDEFLKLIMDDLPDCCDERSEDEGAWVGCSEEASEVVLGVLPDVGADSSNPAHRNDLELLPDVGADSSSDRCREGPDRLQVVDDADHLYSRLSLVPRRARAGLHAAIDYERKMSADVADAWDRRQLREGELLQRPAEFTNPSLGAGSSGNNAKLREDAIDMDDELVEASCDSSSV